MIHSLFSETRNNLVLSERIVFCLLKNVKSVTINMVKVMSCLKKVLKHIKKYLRFYVMFGLTAIICIYILFFSPLTKYLSIYKDSMTIEYDMETKEGYSWIYELENENIKLKEFDNNKWVFVPNKNGKTVLTFYYKKDNDILYKITYGLKVKGNKIIWTSGEGTGLMSYPNPY